jgi:GNAT superfamily N-acetyltransferase
MIPIEVRPVTPADAEDVARLLTQLGYPADPADVPARLSRLAGGGAAALVAERAGVVVGLATVHVLPVLNRPRDVAWLTALVVEAEARGGGVGRALVEAVEAHARAAGCERLSVTTYEDRAGAQAFYERVGLAPTGRRFGKQLVP